MIHPILSFVIVICLLLLFMRGLYWFKNKVPSRFMEGTGLKCSASLSLDDRYKVVVVSIKGAEKVLLLGPTQALVLEDNLVITEGGKTL